MPDPILITTLVAGLVILVVAGNFLVSGAVALAQRLGVAPIVTGMVIVGFGTSLPELIISINAGIQSAGGIALGNIVGSNIANIWLVLALPAFLLPVPSDGRGIRETLLFLLLVTAIWIYITATSPLLPAHGLGLLGLLAVFVGVTIWRSMRMVRREKMATGAMPEPVPTPTRKLVVLIAVGVIGLPIGAHFALVGGMGVARHYGVSEEVIGLTLIGLGTSLPELVAGLIAVIRRRGDILIGNVIGSNIFNILAAGGAVALFGPVDIAPTFRLYDHWVLAIATLTLTLFVMSRSKVSRLAALAMMLVYALYIAGLVNRWNILAEVQGWFHASG